MIDPTPPGALRCCFLGGVPMTTLGEQLTRKKPIARKKGPHEGPDLKPSFGTFQLTMFGVGATVGTGIFFVLQEAVPDAGPAGVVSFLIAGLAARRPPLCAAARGG